MILKITPLDTLFFRTGRPFTGGDESWGEVMFPPLPSTVYGALRTYLITQRGTLKDFKEGKFKEELGTPENRGTLAIKGPLLMRDNGLLFPAPLDIVAEKKGSSKLHELSVKDNNLFISDYPLEGVFIYEGKEVVEVARGWFDEDSFIEYLCSSKPGMIIRENEVYEEEVKVGIARERSTLTTKEGFLYTIPMIRMRKGFSFLVKIEGLKKDIPEKGMLKLGGEGKGAMVESITPNPLEKLQNLELNLSKKIFKIVLLTPAIFNKGWHPEWVSKDKKYIGEYKGVTIQLVACAIGKPVVISGWDIQKGAPKTTRRAVPSGSVYYFKLLDGTPSDVMCAFHLNTISDDEDNRKEGFGLCVVGSVKNINLRR